MLIPPVLTPRLDDQDELYAALAWGLPTMWTRTDSPVCSSV